MMMISQDKAPSICYTHRTWGFVQMREVMKAIVGLYLDMFKRLKITNIQQAKKLTQDEYNYFQIRPEHHRWRYAHIALKHINKTPLSKKSSLRSSLLDKEQKFWDNRIEQLPDGDKFKASLIQTRNRLEEQNKPPSGTA